MVAISKITDTKKIEYVTEDIANGKGVISFDREVELANGNKCTVVKVEFTRNPLNENKILVLQFEDDSNRLKDLSSRMEAYQTEKTLIASAETSESVKIDAQATAAAILAELEKDYKFSLRELNEKSTAIKDYYNVNTLISQIAINTGISDESLIKAVLVLNKLLTIN